MASRTFISSAKAADVPEANAGKDSVRDWKFALYSLLIVADSLNVRRPFAFQRDVLSVLEQTRAQCLHKLAWLAVHTSSFPSEKSRT
jgi:hypothetical protein